MSNYEQTLIPYCHSALVTVVNRLTLKFINAVPSDSVDPEVWLVDPDLVILETVPREHVKIVDDVLVEMDAAEKEDHALPDSLVQAKVAKYAAIDAKTRTLIRGAGFAHNDKVFSLTPEAQSKMMGINQIRSHAAVTYPIVWNTIDDEDSIALNDADSVLNFYLTGVGTYRAHIDSGSVLKAQVRSATTVAEVGAVEDNR